MYDTKKHRGVLPFLVILAVVLLISYAAYGKSQYVQYLPRDESAVTVTKSYSDPVLVVGEIGCPGSTIENLTQEHSTCDSCGTAAEGCPACCLVTSPGKQTIACTAGDNATLYDCKPFLFMSNVTPPCTQLCTGNGTYSCDEPLVHCQNKGCASDEPGPDQFGHLGQSCNQTGSHSWICNDGNITPGFIGCLSVQNTTVTGIKYCQSDRPTVGNSYYDISPVACPSGNATCYSYAPRSDFKGCIDRCVDYADGSETCLQRVDCCKHEKACPSLDGNTTVTRADRCDYSLGGACETIVNLDCSEYTSAYCTDVNNQLLECGDDSDGQVEGTCHFCFKPIKDIEYTFVAKSKEKVVVIWQIATSNAHADPGFPVSSTYFFSRVKVMDNASGKFIHKSVVNQKSFTGAFNIFAATAVDKVQLPTGAEEYILQPGRSYTVRPYYFIAVTGYHLSIQINRVQLTIVRIRD